MTTTAHFDDKTMDVTLEVEELEEVIAPKITTNHSETLVGDDVRLLVEEVEEVIAPRVISNHNETLVID
jgi:phosphotransferase system IIA component